MPHTKLCPHIIRGSAEGRRFAELLKAPAVKLVAGDFQAADSYRQDDPQRLVWGRVYAGPDDLWRSYTPDEYYERFLRGVLIDPAHQAISAWEIINEDYRKAEGGETPDFADLARRSLWEVGVATRMKRDGKRAVFCNLSVGTPSGTYEEQRQAWRAYAGAIRTAYSLGGYIGLHCYGNVSGWEGPLKALNAVMDELRLEAPILITECGNEPGWRDSLTAEDMAARLVAFDQQLAAYPRVIAAAVFSFGDTTGAWRAYNMDEPQITQIVAEAVQASRPETEAPLFSFRAINIPMYLYKSPGSRERIVRQANWIVQVYEVQGAWWRVFPAESTFAYKYVRMSFV